ncbi:MAG: hypothetical protein GF341_06815 [candidate division Zixibacteria bacterium]|nr:hypothetical protein [candidate division Zixibacteria bacterium]
MRRIRQEGVDNMKAANWYGIGVVLLVLAFIDLVFFTYMNHAFYGLQVAIWAVVCFIMGVRADVLARR